MEYCAPRALPHSQFLTWSEEDQDKALAWMIQDRKKCPNCGTNPDDWVKDGRPLDHLPYKVETKRCYGCLSLEDEYERSKGVSGLLRYLVPD